MCGRYIFAEEAVKLYERYGVKKGSKNKQLHLEAKYNIAPGSLVPVITRESPNLIKIMRWGLIPHWAKDPKIGYKLINARAESIDTKPSFRSSFKHKRCLIPATGFYEWKKTSHEKLPYLIQFKTRGIFSFAGIYDIWKDVEGVGFETFTIITTKPNKLVEPMHNRMPVILEKKYEDSWLDEKTDINKLLDMLKPYPGQELEAYKVSTKVNSPKNQGKELISKV